jgi:hypothetical protein
VTISAAMVKDVENLFRAYKALASPELRAAIEREEAVLDLPSFVELRIDVALDRVMDREVGEI